MSNQHRVVTSLNHIIGQERAVGVLRTAIDAYWYDRSKGTDENFPHLLICGPGGTGKTLLTEIVASELCTTVHTELAQNILTSSQMQGLLMILEAEHILLIDEIHELNPMVQVCLYRALEERKLFLGGNKRQSITLPPFTLIGSTTDEHMLTTSMRDRFKILLRLTTYNEDDMSKLLEQRAKRLGWSISSDSIRQLAAKSRGVPRLGIRFLDAAKRVSSSKGSDAITAEHIEQMLVMEGIDRLGLDPVEQAYLQILREYGAPVRLNVLSTTLGLPKQTIEMFEHDFIRLNLITKCEKGRSLTKTGINHLNNLTVDHSATVTAPNPKNERNPNEH